MWPYCYESKRHRTSLSHSLTVPLSHSPTVPLSPTHLNRYVAVLRKHEGFEIPGAEALFCGTRPLVFDLPSYRWYRGHATFLNHSLSGKDHQEELVRALKKEPEVVSVEEMEVLHQTFAWQVIVPRMFDRIRHELAKGKGRRWVEAE